MLIVLSVGILGMVVSSSVIKRRWPAKKQKRNDDVQSYSYTKKGEERSFA
jgi:hypothetical protein